MAFLTRQQLFLVFLLVSLVDVTSLVREWHLSHLIGKWIAGIVVLMDLAVLWKLARTTQKEMPDPSYAAEG